MRRESRFSSAKKGGEPYKTRQISTNFQQGFEVTSCGQVRIWLNSKHGILGSEGAQILDWVNISCAFERVRIK